MDPGVATTPERVARPARVRELVTRAEYARMRQVSRAAVTNAVKRGQIQLVGELVDPIEADRTWPRAGSAPPQQPPTAAAPPAGGAPPPPPPPPPPRAPRTTSEGGRPENVTAYEAKADLDWTRAQLAALELAQAEGRLLDAAEVEKMIFEGYRTVRDALQNIPDTLADAVAVENSSIVCRRLIETAIRQALNELHANLQRAD